MAIAGISTTGYAKAMRQTLPEARREQRAQCAPVRGGEIPKPQGGTSPLGIATMQERVGHTAMQRVREPIFEADLHACSYGYRPKRDAQPAARAMRHDLYNRAWRVVAIVFQAYGTSIPHRKRMTLIAQRIADGSLRRLSKQTLPVGAYGKGPVVPTKAGGPQGSPRAPL